MNWLTAFYMTNREKYGQLCERESFPLHAQEWWIDKSTVGKSWDAIILENADGQIEAAMPYHVAKRFCLKAMLMPVHTFYHYAYIAPDATQDVYDRLVDTLEQTCRRQHVGWLQMQGVYPEPLLDAFRSHGFVVSQRTTYRIEDIPAQDDLPALFSENKRRQLRHAEGLQLVDLSAEDFYAFHAACLAAQNKKIDYPAEWAQSVLPEAVKRRQGRLIAAKDKSGNLQAAMFLAWDSRYGYYLLPTYHPLYKRNGAVAWLTAQALEIIRSKGLQFDFEGSMIPSIASSYRQFGGKPVIYHRIEKFYNPLLRPAVWLRQRL